MFNDPTFRTSFLDFSKLINAFHIFPHNNRKGGLTGRLGLGLASVKSGPDRGIYMFHCSWLLRRSRACFQLKIPFLIREYPHLVVSANTSLQVKHLTHVCEGRKTKPASVNYFAICGSDDEQDLWCISVTSFCLFCVVEHHVSKMTFHHNVKKNLFHISTNIPAFFPVYCLAGDRYLCLQ